jgi:hypothetical protein
MWEIAPRAVQGSRHLQVYDVPGRFPRLRSTDGNNGDGAALAALCYVNVRSILLSGDDRRGILEEVATPQARGASRICGRPGVRGR